jgi:hypothetical protein
VRRHAQIALTPVRSIPPIVAGTRRTARAAVAAVLVSLALAACGSKEKPDDPSCPRVAVLKDLSRLIEFREGTGRDMSDRRYEMVFAGLSSTCVYDKAGVTVNITVQIQAVQGLAGKEPKIKSEYFAALLNPAGDIVEKQPFSAEVEFTNQSRALLSEDLTQRIPLKDRTQGAGYSVLFGFQLSEAQLDYVHKLQGH